MENIVSAVILVGAMGILFAAVLSVAALLLKDKEDETVKKIKELLPMANCGGCGYPGCDGYAAALAEGTATTTACSAGGSKLAFELLVLLGRNDPDTTRKVAFVQCAGKVGNREKTLIYQGVRTCKSLSVIGFDGPCYFGCLGLGDCAAVCLTGAIKIMDGVAVVDTKKCTGCKKCAFYCPKKLITLHWASNMPAVACRNTDKGAVVRNYCKAGCIGCKLCERACPVGAVTVCGNLATFNYEKCTGCLECTKVCKLNLIKTYY